MVARTVPRELRASLRRAFLAMSSDPRGRAVLTSGMASRFAAVRDADYDAIRLMARESEQVDL